jgi:monothiol glutaredoxin
MPAFEAGNSASWVDSSRKSLLRLGRDGPRFGLPLTPRTQSLCGPSGVVPLRSRSRTDMALQQSLQHELDELIASQPVVVFMKGTRRAPRCGFSARVAAILDEFLDDYATVDVLARPEIRQSIKQYSDWPTIPQLYVSGQFVGGCDIVQEMARAGELAQALGVERPQVSPPEVSISDLAAEVLREAAAELDAEVIRLTISRHFVPDLTVGPVEPGDFEVSSNGVLLAVERFSARRANGIRIDFVRTGLSSGFVIDNPNDPGRVEQLGPAELKAWMDQGMPFNLRDVRPATERARASIPGGLPLESPDQLDALPKDEPLILYCHLGVRSEEVARRFRAAGFTRVYNLRGGVDAWSVEVDGSIPRY